MEKKILKIKDWSEQSKAQFKVLHYIETESAFLSEGLIIEKREEKKIDSVMRICDSAVFSLSMSNAIFTGNVMEEFKILHFHKDLINIDYTHIITVGENLVDIPLKKVKQPINNFFKFQVNPNYKS